MLLLQMQLLVRLLLLLLLQVLLLLQLGVSEWNCLIGVSSLHFISRVLLVRYSYCSSTSSSSSRRGSGRTTSSSSSRSRRRSCLLLLVVSVILCKSTQLKDKLVSLKVFSNEQINSVFKKEASNRGETN